MAAFRDIRQALADTITGSIGGLTGYPNVPESVILPCVVVMPGPADFAVAMGRGTDTYDFELVVLVSLRDGGLAQFDLDDYVTGAGDKSVRQAIFQNATLGLAGTTAFVSGWDRYGGEWSIGDVPHIGAALRCQVLTKGTE